MEMYASKEKFESLYPSAPSDAYDRFSWDAQKYIDNATTTVDGTRKLRFAFPTDEEDVEAVERGMCAVINALSEIDAARAAVNAANAYMDTGNGYVSANVKSLSAGGESITYGASAEMETDTSKAARSIEAQNAYVNSLIASYLRGARDKNKINLLYGGRYPGVMPCFSEQ